ncbi:hypothetical protein KOEU_23910 [Komagataeibacter europaeus]|uniref:Uncharacterized protein n=1 Tax=Komagataeibacter europaeus TaxID=33995 RepID=A0A0M0EFX9_KOMEU|nr:hypothetical protein KOEU_23910 [Komagataeibacter europaeus]
MACLEQGSIEGSPVEAVPTLGNDHAGPLRAYGVHDPVDIERLVSKKSLKISRFKERRHPDRVVMLAGDKRKADQIAQGVSHGDDLGGPSRHTASYRLTSGPPFAPWPWR